MNFSFIPNEPTSTEIRLVDGVFIKKNRFARAGMVAAQHAHMYDHVTVCASGSARIEVDGAEVAVVSAGDTFVVRAGVMHFFTTLAPDTVILCIHNADRGEIQTATGETIEYVGV